jgi:hypothetical protein
VSNKTTANTHMKSPTPKSNVNPMETTPVSATTPQTWQERFEKLLAIPNFEDAHDGRKWLEIHSDEHLYSSSLYPESEFEIDEEKIMKFIEKEIALAVQEREADIARQLDLTIKAQSAKGKSGALVNYPEVLTAFIKYYLEGTK